MKTKIVIGWAFSLLLASVVFWNLGRLASGGINSIVESQDKERKVGVGEHAHPRNHLGNSRDGRSRLNAKSNQVSVMDQLEAVAGFKPDLIRKLNIRLFDGGFNLNMEDWDLLGVDKESAASVANDLKGIFNEIKKTEINNFSIIDQSEGRIQISIPKMDVEESAKRIDQIHGSFAQLFGPEMAKAMTDIFLANNPSITGGVIGRERIVTISTASDNAVKNLGKKYEIRTQVLYEGVNLSEVIDNIDSHSQDTGIELVEDVPESWAHFFGESD